MAGSGNGAILGFGDGDILPNVTLARRHSFCTCPILWMMVGFLQQHFWKINILGGPKLMVYWLFLVFCEPQFSEIQDMRREVRNIYQSEGFVPLLFWVLLCCPLSICLSVVKQGPHIKQTNNPSLLARFLRHLPTICNNLNILYSKLPYYMELIRLK